MKSLINFFTCLLVLSAVDYSVVKDMAWLDSRDDQSRTYLVIYYQDGSEDKLLMKKKDIGSPGMYQAIDELVAHKDNK